MKKFAKLIVISAFGLALLLGLLGVTSSSRAGTAVLARVDISATPTPASNANAATKTATNVSTPTAADKTMAKSFVLGKDSLSEYGEVAFNHENHAFKNYSADGKSVIGCVECHHTDQPKSALKLPLVTSEREVPLTMESWKASPQKVNECRSCHFQDGSVPDGKTMPEATYNEGGKSSTKELNNEIAYHINCNTCHDAAFKLRPELKKAPGFATAKDCTICHKAN